MTGASQRQRQPNLDNLTLPYLTLPPLHLARPPLLRKVSTANKSHLLEIKRGVCQGQKQS